MKSNIYLYLIIGAGLLYLFGCDTGTEPQKNEVYMYLNVGDTREYFSSADSSYMVFKITGKTTRPDNQPVYIGEWNSNYQLDSVGWFGYYFIKDGYFISTELDTTDRKEIADVNPFNEQKLAKLEPVDGDSWRTTLGTTDSVNFAYAFYVGKKTTPASTFGNVFKYRISNVIETYYARGIGHIGAQPIDSNSGSVFVTYVNVNGIELGKFVPINNLPKRSPNKIELTTPFGEKLRFAE